MALSTFEEDSVDATERTLRGKRVLLCNAPRDQEGLERLNDWQIYCLAVALDVTTAVAGAWKTSFNNLPRSMQVQLVLRELESYDRQHRLTRLQLNDPDYWSELMQEYLRKELR